MRVYEYVIFLDPKKEEGKPEEKAKILVDRKTVLATSDKQAGIIASRDIPEEYIDRLEEIEVALRPF